MLLRLLQIIPAFRLLIAYLTGVLAFSCNPIYAVSFLLIASWIAFLHRLFKQQLASAWTVRWLPGVGLICVWMAIGCLSGYVAWQRSNLPKAEGENSPSIHLTALVELENDPTEKKRSYQLYVRIRQTDHEGWSGKKLVLYLPKENRVESLACGDRIRFSATLERLGYKPDTAGFDYARWLRIKGICATAFVRKESWQFISNPPRWHLKARANQLRSSLNSLFIHAGLEGDRLALVSAMILGTRSDLGLELKKDFSATGITHILSVSGLHVAVIYTLFRALLFFLGFSRTSKKVRQVIIILLLWVYAFVTGLSPSVNRSAMMFTLLALGECMDRHSRSLNTVLFSAFLLLLWNPLFVYDVGFQLSYCAVLGIVVVYPKMKGLWQPPSKLLTYFWEMACLSFVAQLVTAPLTISYFGQFPNYFLLANLVAVPLSGWLIYLSAAFLIFSQMPWLSGPLAWCLERCTGAFLSFVKIMGGLPYAVTEGIVLKIDQVVLLYLLMLGLFGWLFMKQRRWMFGVLICLFLFQLTLLIHGIG